MDVDLYVLPKGDAKCLHPSFLFVHTLEDGSWTFESHNRGPIAGRLLESFRERRTHVIAGLRISPRSRVMRITLTNGNDNNE